MEIVFGGLLRNNHYTNPLIMLRLINNLRVSIRIYSFKHDTYRSNHATGENSF